MWIYYYRSIQNSDKGRGGPKIQNFCERPLCMVPSPELYRPSGVIWAAICMTEYGTSPNELLLALLLQVLDGHFLLVKNVESLQAYL